MCRPISFRGLVMSESVHERSLRLAGEWLDNISDEQFLKEYNAIENKNKILGKGDFKETLFFRKMVDAYLDFCGDFPLSALSDLKNYVDYLKNASPSTRTHYQGLDEYVEYKYSYIHDLLDKYGFVNGNKELNNKNKPASFFFEIYSRLDSFAGSQFFISSDGVTPSKSSARDRNNWLISELEQLLRFIEIDIMPSLVVKKMNLSKYFFEIDAESARNTVAANTNGKTIIRASVSNESKDMVVDIYFLNKPLKLSLEQGVFSKSFNEAVFESDTFLLDVDHSKDADFIINSISKEEHSLYEMFGYNQSYFFKFSDHEKIQPSNKRKNDLSDDMTP